MKKVLMLLAAVAMAGSAQADEGTDDGSQSYITNLCTIVTQEKSPATADAYINQLKDLDARGHSSSSMNTSQFDEDEARTVVAAWMNLNDAQKKEARQSEQACHDATLNEYQSQD
ncbi:MULTISPECIES: hypothetical protein [unclassified Erwinia]|uniref:hypothetical protein n=1 Tax=unclassified Erwinia TaxID=2622719 RepID=UPI000829D5AF|nr:hypothetical protein [Erwinia sp. ErVv1]